MKTAKKLLALFLVLVLSAGLCSGAAFADEKTEDTSSDPICVVSIGNQSANGFGLADYGSQTVKEGWWRDGYSNTGKYSFGFLGNISAEAYPYTFCTYLRTLAPLSRTVELINLSMEGMRTDELRAILQRDFSKLAANKGVNGDTYLKDKLNRYNAWFGDAYNSKKLGDKDIYTYFADSIKKADFITIDLSMSNLGEYLFERLQAIFGVNGYNMADYSEKASDLESESDLNVVALESGAKEIAKNYISKDSGLTDAQIDAIVEAMAYCYADFCANFTKDIQFIRSLNPTAKLIVLSAYNTLTGIKVDCGGGKEVDLGTLCSAYVSLVNNFLTNACKYKAVYFYADCSFGAKSFVQDAALATSADQIDGVFADALIEDILNMNGGNTGTLYIAKRNELQELKQKQKELVDADDLGDEWEQVCKRISDIENDATFAELNANAAKIIDSYMRAARMTTIDLGGVLGLLERGMEIVKTTVYGALLDWENAGSAAKSMVNVYMRFFAADGMGSAPDSYGHSQKYEAVKDAYTKVLPANTDGETSLIGSFSGAFSSILNIFNSPVLEKISGFFTNLSGMGFSFKDFFSALKDGFSNFLTNLFPT